jgi:hypothetical protein
MIERQTRAKAVMLDELLECAAQVAAKKAPKKPLTASSAAARWVACRILNDARPAVFTVDQPTTLPPKISRDGQMITPDELGILDAQARALHCSP